MDRATLAIFIHELRNQCIYTEAAFKVFNQALEQNAQAGVFFAAQATLLSASQIASLLWPAKGRTKGRGDELRQMLQLTDDHSLNDSRLTELWEHSDEKLEDWIGITKGEKVVFDHVGSLEQLTEQVPIQHKNVFRLYDPATMIFYFRGEGFKMQIIADAIANIYSRVLAIHKQMFPDQHQKPPQPAADESTQSKTSASESSKSGEAKAKGDNGKAASKKKK